MELLAFLSYTWIMSITPGPNNLMALAESRRAGFRGAAPFLWGLFVSFFIVNGIVYGSLQFLQEGLPWIEGPLKLIGSAYIAYLAYAMVRPAAGRAQKDSGKERQFLAGMVLNMTNIKVIIFMSIGYTSFIFPVYEEWWIRIGLGIVMCLACTASNLIWAAAGAALDRFFTRYDKAVNRVLAALLLLSAAEIWL